MKIDSKRFSIALGSILISPLFYRRESIDWNGLFPWIFMLVGVFLLVIGLLAEYRAFVSGSTDNTGRQEQNIELVTQDLTAEVKTGEERIAGSKTTPKLSSYYKFAKVLGLSPLLPLALFILISTSCSVLGTGLGFACNHPGNGGVFWLEIFFYSSMCLVLSLPAWGLLVFAGNLLKIR